MRLIAQVENHPSVKRLMIHQHQNDVFLFIFEIEEDGGCSADLWFDNMEDALEVATSEYGISKETWQEIPNPLEHCQQDWITPARIPGRESGNPQWGKLEILKDGEWIRIMG